MILLHYFFFSLLKENKTNLFFPQLYIRSEFIVLEIDLLQFEEMV